MQILINNAISNAKTNPELSQRQALLQDELVLDIKLECLMNFRMVFCKKCKSFIAPGKI